MSQDEATWKVFLEGWHVPEVLKDGGVEAVQVTGQPSRGCTSQGDPRPPSTLLPAPHPYPKSRAGAQKGTFQRNTPAGRSRENGLVHAEYHRGSDISWLIMPEARSPALSASRLGGLHNRPTATAGTLGRLRPVSPICRRGCPFKEELPSGQKRRPAPCGKFPAFLPHRKINNWGEKFRRNGNDVPGALSARRRVNSGGLCPWLLLPRRCPHRRGSGTDGTPAPPAPLSSRLCSLSGSQTPWHLPKKA